MLLCVNGMKEWKNTSIRFEFHAFLAGVIECKFWNVWKLTSFCIDFAKSLVLGHELSDGVQISFLLGAGNAGFSYFSWIFE